MNTLEFFKPHVGSAFDVQLDGDFSFPITLIEATALPICEYPDRTRDPFELKFQGDESVLLHQLTHRLKHSALGNLEVFLVPVGQENGNFIYQAIYN